MQEHEGKPSIDQTLLIIVKASGRGDAKQSRSGRKGTLESHPNVWCLDADSCMQKATKATPGIVEGKCACERYVATCDKGNFAAIAGVLETTVAGVWCATRNGYMRGFKGGVDCFRLVVEWFLVFAVDQMVSCSPCIKLTRLLFRRASIKSAHSCHAPSTHIIPPKVRCVAHTRTTPLFA
jgi:hypothetical protein